MNISERIIAFLEEKKADEVTVIDMEGRSPFFDEIIIATVPSLRALSAYAEEVEEILETLGAERHKIEGNEESEWVLVDGGDFVLHLLTKEKREELSLEKLIAASN